MRLYKNLIDRGTPELLALLDLVKVNDDLTKEEKDENIKLINDELRSRGAEGNALVNFEASQPEYGDIK